MTWVNVVVQGILLGGLYALFACGLSVMFGVMRIVNLAHGDLAVIAAFLAFSFMSFAGVNALIAAAVVVPLMAVLGYALQRGLLQRSLSSGPFSTLLATFGLSIIIQNVLLQHYSADSHSLSVGRLASESFFVNSEISIAYLSLISFVLAVIVLLALQTFLSRTGLGRMLRASSDDPEAAQLVGGDSKHIYGVATAIALATVAVAGLLFAMRSSFSPSTGPTRLLFAFEAVVIGGLGSIWGTFLGGMVLGLAQTIGAQIDPALTLLAGHLIFLAVLAFRPQGIIPARSERS
jgi:branched-chain amino acid transport system permease protein